MNFQEPAIYVEEETQGSPQKPQIPLITIPSFSDFNEESARRLSRENSIIELQNLEIAYDLQSVSSCDSDTVIEVETTTISTTKGAIQSKFVKNRETVGGRTIVSNAEDVETCLSVVIERRDNDDGDEDSGGTSDAVTRNDIGGQTKRDDSSEKARNSEIVLSPLQLGQ